MPRVGATTAQKAQIEKDTRTRHWQMMMASRLKEIGSKDKDVREKTSIKHGTYYQRKNNPDEYRVSELRELLAAGAVTPKGICDLIGIRVGGQTL